MGEIALAVFKWFLKSSLIFAIFGAVLALVAFVQFLIAVGLQDSVLSDIFLFVQMWAPFNLNVVTIWIFTTAGLYLAFRIALLSFLLFQLWIRD